MLIFVTFESLYIDKCIDAASGFQLHKWKPWELKQLRFSTGVNDDGDIFNEDNQEVFRKFVMESTDGNGVHFVMADGVGKCLEGVS